MRSGALIRCLAWLIGAGLFAFALVAWADANTVQLQPGQRYVIKKYTGVVPCPGKWEDYDRLPGLSYTDAIRTVVQDGGTTFITGDSFTVVSVSNAPRTPVQIRSTINGKLCWLPNDTLQDLIGNGKS